MNLRDFLAGIDILRSRYKDLKVYNVNAEHDQFFIGPTDTPLSAAEVKTMHGLGWFQEEVADDEPYDPEEGWSAFI